MRTQHPNSGVAPASGPAVWRGVDQLSRDWVVPFSERECADLIAAADALRGRDFDEIGRADFRISCVAPKIAAIADGLINGTGFVMLRGMPVGGVPQDVIELIYWGLGSHLGVVVSQSAAGDRLGHVYDRGTGDKERYYTRGGALEFHMDPVDVVGLLCLRTALSGGASRIVSAGAVHNTILAERPDLLAILYRGFHNSRRGHGEATSSARVPVFAHGASGLESYFLPETIRQATEEGFPLTKEEQEALDYIAEVSNRPELFLDMDFRVGDIQFLNNRTIFHSRTDYVDYPEPERKRHLLRLWLMMPQWQRRHPAMNFHDKVDASGGGVRKARIDR